MVTRDSLFYLYFVELAYAFSLAFSKLAILAFYWRMFKTSGIKIPIITLIVATVVWLIIRGRRRTRGRRTAADESPAP